MPIGTNTGEYYQDNFEWFANKPQKVADTFDQRFEASFPDRQPQSTTTPSSEIQNRFQTLPQSQPQPKPQPQEDELPPPQPGRQRIHVTPKEHIDREHDVPLLAGALEHPETGEYYGTAIDRRIPHYTTIDGLTFDTSQFVKEHERVEIEEMKRNLSHLSDAEAYKQAHDQVATPHEKQLVQQFATDNGKDPESFWDKYQRFWTRHLAEVQENSPEKVHPHLYTAPYASTNFRDKVEAAKANGALAWNNPLEPFGEFVTKPLLEGIHEAAGPIVKEHQRPLDFERLMSIAKEAGMTLRFGEEQVMTPTKALKEASNAPRIEHMKEKPTRHRKGDKKPRYDFLPVTPEEALMRSELLH
jgi:hypothetical protein